MSGLELEWVKALLGSGGAVGVLGFAWRKIEKRFTKIESELKACRLRETASQGRERISDKMRGIQITVIELLWMNVKQRDPKSAVLDRAKHLMDELKLMEALKCTPPPEDPELTALARRLDDD